MTVIPARLRVTLGEMPLPLWWVSGCPGPAVLSLEGWITAKHCLHSMSPGCGRELTLSCPLSLAQPAAHPLSWNFLIPCTKPCAVGAHCLPHTLQLSTREDCLAFPVLSFRHELLQAGSAHRDVPSLSRGLPCPSGGTVPCGGDIPAVILHQPCPAAHPCWVCAGLGWAALPSGRKAQPLLHLLCWGRDFRCAEGTISAASTPELARTGAGCVLFTALPQGIAQPWLQVRTELGQQHRASLAAVCPIPGVKRG